MAKSVKANYLFNLINSASQLLFPLITFPYASRIMMADGIGQVNFFQSIISYISLFTCLGIPMYAIREVAKVRDNPEKMTRITVEILLLHAFLTLLGYMAVAVICLTVTKVQTDIPLFLLLSATIFFTAIGCEWFYQGIEDFKKIVIRNILVKIIGIVCIFAFVKTKADLPLYAVIYSLSLLLGNLSMWLTINKYIHFIPVHKLHIKKHIRPTLVLFFPQIAISIYTVLDRFMIGIITNNTIQIGYYEQAQKIVKLALTLVTSLSTVMLPRIAHLYVQNDQKKIVQYTKTSLRYTFIIAFPIMFGLMGISSNLIPWFLGEEFINSSQILMITSPIVVFMGISNIIGFQYLIPTQRQKIYTISTIIGSIVNLILNCLLIPIFLSAGAAIASVTAEFGVSIFQLYCIRKEINFIEVLKQSKLYIISSIIMFICIYFFLWHRKKLYDILLIA